MIFLSLFLLLRESIPFLCDKYTASVYQDVPLTGIVWSCLDNRDVMGDLENLCVRLSFLSFSSS